ncbi:phospholipase D-like domain-containing protein [Ruegeria sp. SCP11]|uniref:phospholipase D-like domain-containing protein n=1 Tax=Ruegeria sp. SCP11 TaxID=3141378 RepID=UPI0033352CA2
MKAYFTSQGRTAYDAITEFLDQLLKLPADREIRLLVMTFSFTDAELAQAFVTFCRVRRGVQLCVLADWGQFKHAPSMIPDPIPNEIPGAELRYTCDQPYVWDRKRKQWRWSYHASLGFLHHKGVIALVDDRPFALVCGSANWTRTARKSFENTLYLSADVPGELEIIARFALEFQAIWCDGQLSLPASAAETTYAALCGRPPQLKRPPPPVAEAGQMRALSLASLENSDQTMIAFSGRMNDGDQCFGYARDNHERACMLAGPNGKPRMRPLSITTLSLAVIFAARPGDRLWLAMFGLSPRVAEFGALLDAARSGVLVRVILDASVGGEVAIRLRSIVAQEALSVEVRTSARTMHQKYCLCPERSCIATGTANMSVDSSKRHSEHRMLLRDSPDLTAVFCKDFDDIWEKTTGINVP